jgi:hypothetical protein
MISHKDCDHPSTPSARAKCRRARGGATPKEVDFTPRERAPKERKQSTPRDRDKQCMNCGIERIMYQGTDPLTGIILLVGERCEYMVRRSLDKVEVV